jgi:ADP-ribose pyrophosphatase YjhB (NUDIX family)
MDWKIAINQYNPSNRQEQKDKEIIIGCINRFDNILSRDNQVIHITSSGFVINAAKDKVLMIHHNIFNSWSLTGGHADGDEDLLGVAVREVKEETGVMNIKPLKSEIASLDLLAVHNHTRKGEYVASHLHASIVYILEADERDELIVKEDENSAVKWIPLDEINLYSNEPHMKYIYEKIVRKIKMLK